MRIQYRLKPVMSSHDIEFFGAPIGLIPWAGGDPNAISYRLTQLIHGVLTNGVQFR